MSQPTNDDLLANGKSYRFSFVMEAKSIVTRPGRGAASRRAGAYEITGLAWSGRARVAGVEVSTDGGKNWLKTEIAAAGFEKCCGPFSVCRGIGTAMKRSIGSRCTDESGYVAADA